jgi:hypothetical protein
MLHVRSLQSHQDEYSMQTPYVAALEAVAAILDAPHGI